MPARLRRLGPRIWPMVNIENLTIPGRDSHSGHSMAWEKILPDRQATRFCNQVLLQLKTARGLVALPNELIATSSPAVDTAVTELLAVGLGNKEDTAFFATTTQTGGPVSIYAAAGTTKFAAANNNANGGTVTIGTCSASLSRRTRQRQFRRSFGPCIRQTFHREF